jgi:hypothetical protein
MGTITKKAVNADELSAKYTLATVMGEGVLEAVEGDTYFALRGVGTLLGVVRAGKVIGVINTKKLGFEWANDWMEASGG